MKTLIFEGSSDDTFGEQTTSDDHDNAGSGKPIRYVVESGDDRLMVFGQFAPGKSTGWMIGVAPYDKNMKNDGGNIPLWPMRLAPGDAHYSPRLEIDVPDDATIECLERK
ncbi:MAG: hypothetical protein E6Q97_29525 [Desulfurellales bacterium]|nr:MAG: hypothetical protein E6Q97_29525 [Desulfurellales bacterium]